MKKLLLAGVCSALMSTAASASVVYSSIPDLTAPGDIEWCSDCYGGGTFEPLDQFTLGSGATIGGLNLVAYNDGGYNALSPFDFEIYNADHSVLLFSRSITPTAAGAAGNSSDLIVNGTFAPINLAAGTYWAGFIAPFYAVTGFNSGGNGSLIDTTPHTGIEVFALGGNTGYQLLGAGGVPEPAAWALMIVGFGAVGAAQRRRKTTVAFA